MVRPLWWQDGVTGVDRSVPHVAAWAAHHTGRANRPYRRTRETFQHEDRTGPIFELVEAAWVGDGCRTADQLSKQQVAGDPHSTTGILRALPHRGNWSRWVVWESGSECQIPISAGLILPATTERWLFTGPRTPLPLVDSWVPLNNIGICAAEAQCGELIPGRGKLAGCCGPECRPRGQRHDPHSSFPSFLPRT